MEWASLTPKQKQHHVRLCEDHPSTSLQWTKLCPKLFQSMTTWLRTTSGALRACWWLLWHTCPLCAMPRSSIFSLKHRRKVARELCPLLCSKVQKVKSPVRSKCIITLFIYSTENNEQTQKIKKSKAFGYTKHTPLCLFWLPHKVVGVFIMRECCWIVF